MAKKTRTQTRAATRAATLTAITLFIGAGLAAAAGIVSSAKPSSALLVRMTPAQPLHAEAVAGAEDVTLLSFDLLPRGGDATVSQMTFSVFGDLDDDFATIDRDADVEERFLACSLTQTDGTAVAGPEPVAADGSLTFTDAMTVTKDAVTTRQIRCDLSTYGESGGDPDRFAATIAGESGVTATIGGTALSGSSLAIGKTSADTLNETAGVSVSVSTQGTLFVSLAPDTPSSAIVLGGTTDNRIGRWELRATGEDFLVSTLSFTDAADGTVAKEVTLVCETEDGSEYTDTRLFSAGMILFTDAECYVSPVATEGIVLTVDTNDVGSGTSSGNKMRMVLTPSGSSFSALGLTSGISIDETDVAGSISSREMTVRQSKPTITYDPVTSTSATPGVTESYRFDVEAESGGAISLSQMIFRVSATDNAGSGWNTCGDGTTTRFANPDRWTLANEDDPSVAITGTLDWMFLDDAGKPCGTSLEHVAYAVLNLTGDATTPPIDVDAGESEGYVLWIDTTGASSADDDTIKLEMLDERSAFPTRMRAIQWDDTDAGVTDINGMFLEALPLVGDTIQF